MRAAVSKLGLVAAFVGLMGFGLFSGCADDGEDGSDGACQLELDADGTRTLVCGEERVLLPPSCEDGFPRDVMLSPPITELVAGLGPAEAFSPFVPYELFELTGCTAIQGSFFVVYYQGEQLPASVARLKHVEGMLAVQYNPNLTSFTELENLETMGGLVVAGNPLLTDLPAFENIRALDYTNNLNAGLLVADNEVLTNLNGLEGIESVSGNVVIMRNKVLTDLSGLQNIETIHGGLQVTSNDVLERLDVFQRLVSLGVNDRGESILINDHPVLDTITGFDALESLEGTLQIYDNDRLTTVSSFGKLQSTGGDISFSYSDALTSVSGFGVLKTLSGVLGISTLPRLTEIRGFDALSDSETNVQIFENPSLQTIEGFSATRDLGSLWIVDNAKLTEIDGFHLLSRVWGNLSVYDNPLFSQCTATERFGGVVVDDTRVISPNKPCP